jgi:GMP synthase (glutamine-hydrolysing) A subunit
MSSALETILVLDFGSQYTQLIARRIREANVYSEVVPFNTSVESILQHRPRGIVLSGGPDSVYEAGAPACDPKIYDLGIPILGVCYGMQLLAKDLGGKVVPGAEREYGPRDIQVIGKSCLLDGIKRVWMSHGDRILEPPPHFQVTARSETAMAGNGEYRQENLRNPVPSRSDAHTEWHCRISQVHLRCLRLSRFLDDGFVYRTLDLAHQGTGRKWTRNLCDQRRSGFHRRRHSCF